MKHFCFVSLAFLALSPSSSHCQADFTLEADPAVLSVTRGQTAVFHISVGQVAGFNDPVTLSVSGNPGGTAASFETNPIAPSGFTRMTIANTEAAVAGEYPLHIVAVAPTSTHTVDVTLNITAPVVEFQDFFLDVQTPEVSVCTPNDADFNIRVGSIMGYNDPVTLSAQGNPPGTTVGFSQNPVVPPGSSIMTISNTGAAVAGYYNVGVVAVAPTSTHFATPTLALLDTTPTVPALQDPADGAVGVSTLPILSWTGDSTAASYQVELAEDSSFASVLYSSLTTRTTHRPKVTLSPVTTYFWRVTGLNPCGVGMPSAPFSYETGDEPCRFDGQEIPDADAGGLDSSLQISGTGTILDLQLSIVATHSYVGDLVFTLTHQDTGTSVVVIDRPGFPTFPFGCAGNNIDVILDDNAAISVEDLCGATGPAIQGTAIPEQALQAFEGEEFSGTWVLSAYDRSSQDVGSLVEWCLLPTVAVLPELNCPSSLNVPNDSGMCGADVALAATATGVPPPTIEYLVGSAPIANPNFFPVGNHTVEVIATNQLGSASCEINVQVQDAEMPSALCQDVTVELNGMGTANILPASLDLGSADNCGIAETVISRGEFSCADLGPQDVVFSVTDTNGLVGMCTATVIVVDTIPPTVEVPHLGPIQANESGQAPIPSLTGLTAASDNCTLSSNLVLTQQPIAGAMVGVGTSEITIFAQDTSGNIGSGSTILTVIEASTPTPTPTPSATPTVSPTSTEMPTVTLTPGKVCDYDIFPAGGDGRIDSLDLLELLRTATDPEILADFSRCWFQSMNP